MKVNFMKQKMELVWHSCTDCLPNEDFNSRLKVFLPFEKGVAE